MGHYIACRRYGVDATLPFFIPAPPLFLAGTFGAFIKMKSPIPSRRALFDIGLAGPLGGFRRVVARCRHWSAEPGKRCLAAGCISNDFQRSPADTAHCAKLSGTDLSLSVPNPFYMAAWIGLLVTSLNLMPVGQLDGGHGTFAVFGPRCTANWDELPLSRWQRSRFWVSFGTAAPADFSTPSCWQ